MLSEILSILIVLLPLSALGWGIPIIAIYLLIKSFSSKDKGKNKENLQKRRYRFLKYVTSITLMSFGFLAAMSLVAIPEMRPVFAASAVTMGIYSCILAVVLYRVKGVAP